ncbi:MAG: iron chelate uptake ABC transporter family permease subunit [Bauldia sp.]|nr:iron chelate uptake ABC transporter family permease subunit [Bauldia sp.]MCW5717530.1 iron chelate uptake ABC transporter family permease subunit [Bauldia sp.]
MTAERAGRSRRRRIVIGVMLLVLAAVFVLTLTVGQSVTPIGDVIRVIMGERVPGASFTVGTLRLPRATLSIVTGLCFGLGGVAFQTMLRNPLASPDIIGISASASAAAVFAIVILSLTGPAVSAFAIAGGLGIAILIYLLSFREGVVGARIILIGIGLAAMLHSFIAYVLSRAAAWDYNDALRWLTGSVNGATWGEVLPALAALVIFGGMLLGRSRALEMLRLGDDTAAALGVRVSRTRIVVLVAAVGLISFATAAAGPIAFVAFLSGPIAARIVRRNGPLLVPGALVGALLVLLCDYAGQFLLGTRYPVGVVTGALGAPFLIYLIVRANRAGGSL